MAHILLLTADPDVRDALSVLLPGYGHAVQVAATVAMAMSLAESTAPDVMLADLDLPGDLSGVEIVERLHARMSDAACIFLTGYESIPIAVAAVRRAEHDYLTKPIAGADLLKKLDHALEGRRLRKLAAGTPARPEGWSALGIVGLSPAMQDVVRVLPRIARTTVNVLISGESGTGKELVARSLHRQSKRAAGPFVAVNSPAIPANLVESEFFGHERGAFTDAKDQRIGRFEQADGGTLFLDEVGDLPLEAQAKLLRVLEDREVTRLGGRTPKRVDVWVLAATNRHLEDAVGDGTFREDLYWRLNGMPIRLPSLRERIEDIPLLVDHLRERLNVELGLAFTGVTAGALEMLCAHDWPGNVRELANALRRAMIVADGETIDWRHLALVPASSGAESGGAETLGTAVGRATSRVERSLIESALARCRGNRTAAARLLGINRKTLLYKMRDLDIEDQRPNW